MKLHKIRTVIQVGNKLFSTPSSAAAALSGQCAWKLSKPKARDFSLRRSEWDSEAYFAARNRIEKRAYARFLKVCKVLIK